MTEDEFFEILVKFDISECGQSLRCSDLDGLPIVHPICKVANFRLFFTLLEFEGEPEYFEDDDVEGAINYLGLNRDFADGLIAACSSENLDEYSYKIRERILSLKPPAPPDKLIAAQSFKFEGGVEIWTNIYLNSTKEIYIKQIMTSNLVTVHLHSPLLSEDLRKFADQVESVIEEAKKKI